MRVLAVYGKREDGIVYMYADIAQILYTEMEALSGHKFVSWCRLRSSLMAHAANLTTALSEECARDARRNSIRITFKK